jgi:hypothetical protein
MIGPRRVRASHQLLTLTMMVSLSGWACSLTSNGEFDGLVPRPTGGGGASCDSASDLPRPECNAGVAGVAGVAGETASGAGGLMQDGAAGAATGMEAGAGAMPATGSSGGPAKTGVELRSGGFVVGSPGAGSGVVRVLGSFVAFSPGVPSAGSRVAVRGAFR